MSEIILNYINETLKLPYQIKNIEKEFKNGYLFNELLKQYDYFKTKLSNYYQNPKNILEINENFKSLKNNLKLIGININNSTIDQIIAGNEGVAPKLIYKIKIEMDRIKINFNNLIEKINENSFREKYLEKNNIIFNYFNKSNLLELTKSNKFPISPNMTAREPISSFSKFRQNEKNIINKDNKKDYNDIKFIKLNNKIKLKPLSQNKEKEKEKEKEITSKDSNKSYGFRALPNIEKSKSVYEKEDIIYEDEKNTNNKYYLTHANDSNKKPKKIKSKSLYNDKNKKLKINISKDKISNIVNYEKFIKYSLLENNAKKLGININEISPRLKKTGKNIENEYYFSSNQLINHFKSLLTIKKENKGKKLNLTADKKKILIPKEIKKSILNEIKNKDKLFSVQLNKLKKNGTQYKIKEYNKLINSNNNFNNKLNENLYFSFIKFHHKNKNNIGYEDNDDYNNIVNKEKQNLDEKKQKIQNPKNYAILKKITNLIIDFTEECFKSQIKLKEELIDLPEYREWIQYFIEGKSCLRIPIKKIRGKNDISKNDRDSMAITNSSILTKLTKKSDKKKEKKNSVYNNNELIFMECIDYLFYRGNWDINNFVDKNLYGKYLHIYNVLGNDIFNIIQNDNHLFHELKPSILLQKKNNEFELKEDELDNIFIPKSNVRNILFTEIILLNFDNICHEIINNSNNILNNLNLTKINSNENNISDENHNSNNIKYKEKEQLNKKKDFDFSYIPIKICLIGHSYSGRKTQAKLLCEKYQNLKSYSINEITSFYLDEYKRLHTPIENNPKFKTLKKNQIIQMKEKMEEELKLYKNIFTLIENDLKINKNTVEENKFEEINIEEISDELKINILINEIQKDFPKKEENIINEEIQIRIQKKKKLEEELNKLKEEINNDISNINNNNKDKDKEKKSKNKPKNNNINNIENINEELEKIINESFEGFILYDYPNNYIQFQKLENMLTGFIQEIDKNPDKRDIYMNILTNSIDKPYINISNINREVSSYLNKNNLYIKSFFNCYILLELSEEETLKRMNNRLKDPNTDIIYHKEYSPPNPSDKKLIERLVPLNEPNDDTIKELITHFYSEYPDIIYFLHLFNNLYRIDLEDKNEIFKKIENIILGEIKKYEERENKDIIINNNYEFNDENETMRYFKRLNETKKFISKELSEDIIKIWNEQQDKYLLGIKHFLSNFIELKNNFIEQMNIYQEEFIDYLNNSSKKYKLVDIFYKKYNILLEKYPFLKNIHLVKEEFNRNIIELIDHIWELIQMKKRDSISELNNIKNQNFIDNQLEIFGEYIINLIILETNHYYKKINIITKFYYEFERSKISDKFPYEYIFNKEFILENINELPIFTSDLNLNSQQSKSSISPKIEKIYNNCHKLLFDYDKTMIALNKKYKEEYNTNTNVLLNRNKKKIKSFRRKNTIKSEISENKNCINYEQEMKTALLNEKIKYKIKILFLKNFAEKNLIEIYDLGQNTFNKLDKFIVESVKSQNDAMNELVLKIKNNINEGVYKLNIKDIELDIFDIYEKNNSKFTKFNLNYLYSIPEEDKKINYNDLYMIYLDIKAFEIQKNYVTMNTVIDILFKKHLFEYKSPGFMKYMHKIPFYYLNNYINKFIIKKDKGYSLIKINELFTSLALLNISPPKNEQQTNMMKSINDKLKYKIYLTKDDFMNSKMWFENYEEIIKTDNNINTNNKDENKIINNFINDINKSEIDLNKNNKRKSKHFIQSNNIINLNKAISDDKKLKEFLFNVNKNEEQLIDFIDFMKRIFIKKNYKKKKSTHFLGSEIKSSIDKADILSQNSFVDSIDKTQMSESTTNYFRGSKNMIMMNNNNLNENKLKSFKCQKFNDTLRDLSEDKTNNNINEMINFPEYTYFDYLIKKA